MKSKVRKKRPIHQITIVIEKHGDYYMGYPLGIKGACVGQGETYAKVVDDTIGAIKAHIAAFGEDVIGDLDSPVTGVLITEISVNA